jgi:predicted dehydrogenase
MKVLNWGILGTGMIADRFARGLASTDDAARYAVASREKERAQDFAMKFGFARAYGGYESVIRDQSVDAVYVALPNHLHADWAVKAAEGGKHVLLEKPATIHTAELEAVLAAAKKSGVFFMEAFMYRCHPRIARLREVLADGRIGQVRRIDTVFEVSMRSPETNIRMKNEMGGGALMDLGCYCVSFCRMVAGAEPESVSAEARIDPAARIDLRTSGRLTFPGGVEATFVCANNAAEVRAEARIEGTAGNIVVHDPWGPVEDGAPIVITAGENVQTLEVKLGKDLYANEALTVAEHLEAGQAPQMNWEDSLGQVRTMDKLRAAMGLRFDCE